MGHIARAAMVLTVFAGISKISGFFREMTVAAIFGVSPEVDAFLVAAVIPFLLTGFFQRAIPAIVIPLYHDACQESQAAGNKLAQSVLGVVVLFSVVLMAAGYSGAELLVRLIAPGFSPDMQELTVRMLYWLLPLVLLNNCRDVLGALQQAHRVFLWSSLGPVAVNLVTISGILLFYTTYGIKAAALATLLAGIAQLLVQAAGMGRCPVKLTGKFALLPRKDCRKLAMLAFPIFMSVMLTQINVIVERNFASALPGGTIAVLNYAQKLQVLFFAFCGAPLITAVFPDITRRLSAADTAGARRLMIKTVKMIIVLTVPVSVVLSFFPEVLVRLIFQHGNFSSEATVQTALVLRYYAFGLVQYGLMDFFYRYFAACKRIIIPVMAALIIVATNILCNFLFVRMGLMGAAGISLAATGGLTAGVAYSVWQIRRMIRD